MADVIFRIPSRTVTYGYVEVPISLPEGVDVPPEILASQYVNYVVAFQREEEATVERLKEGVSAPQGASQEAAPGDPQAAADRLADGRKPRTVAEADEMAKQVIERELGPTTEVDEKAPPWTKKVAPKKKEWETEEAAPKAAEPEGW